MAKKVAMVLAKNFEDVEATSPKEHREGPGIEVTVIGIDGSDIDGNLISSRVLADLPAFNTAIAAAVAASLVDEA